jgi:gamma-butyrobetaine dioxygenase
MNAETLGNVQVTWPDGERMSLPTLWLRDVCPCEECRVAQTQEKRFHLASIETVAVDTLHVNEEALWVTWTEGHSSLYPRSFLSGDHARVTPRWQPWSDDYSPAYVDFQLFQGDDQPASVAIEEFLRSGVLILSDAPTEEATLELLAKRFGPIREVLFERIHNVKVDPKGYNVAHTNLGLPPHNDFASYSWPPSVQALHMLANEASGGRSTIFDSWGLLEEFRSAEPEAFDVLCRVAVPFREFDESNETYACEPIIRLNAKEEFVIFRYSNQLMQVMNPTDPDTAAFYDAYYKLSRCLFSTDKVRRFRLEGGQILIVASHRVLHGREAIDDAGYRHLQDAYFEHDNVRNMLTVLARLHD